MMMVMIMMLVTTIAGFLSLLRLSCVAVPLASAVATLLHPVSSPLLLTATATEAEGSEPGQKHRQGIAPQRRA